MSKGERMRVSDFITLRRVAMRTGLTLVVGASTVCLPSSAQSPVTISTDGNDPVRPVSSLAGELRKREGVAVTYEDPRYAKRGDMHGKPWTFVYSPEEIRGSQGPEQTIARMLREASAAGGPVFKVLKEGSRLHIVPSEVLNDSGARARQASILDTVIDVPPAGRDGGDLIQAICDAVQQRTGYEIGIGPSAPSNNLAEYHTGEGVAHMTARAALQHVLDKATPVGTYVWDLYYDPADHGYGLNFVYVGFAGRADR